MISNWGATLGGGYYVWRSGLRYRRAAGLVFVYGPALNVQGRASLLRRAGAVEALQVPGHQPGMDVLRLLPGERASSGPSPHALLPDQQGSTYRYYSVYSRDFTVVYAR